jgi:hypothetical protein
VGIGPEDYPGDVLAGMEFQRVWERRAFVMGGGDYRAPGQRVGCRETPVSGIVATRFVNIGILETAS